MARFARSIPPRSRLLRKPSIWWNATTGPGSTAITNVDAGWLDEPSQRETASGQFSDTTVPWPITLVPAPGGRPGLAVPVSVPANYQRYEQEPHHQDFGDGDGPWFFSQAFYLGPNYPLNYINPSDTYAYQVIEQMRQDSTVGSPVVAFEARNGGLQLSGGNNVNTNSPSAWSYGQTLAALATQTWYALVYAMNFSATAGASTLNVWLNGTQVLANFTIPPPTVIAGTGNGRTLRKMGIYHKSDSPAATLWQAGAAFGPTSASVDPALPLNIPAHRGQMLM